MDIQLARANAIIQQADAPNIKNFEQLRNLGLQANPTLMANEFFTPLFNVWKLEVMNSLRFEDFYSEVFTREKFPWADGIGLTEIDTTTPTTWVKPTGSTLKTYNELDVNVDYVYTTLKDVYQEDISTEILRAATSTPGQFNSFVALYAARLYDSVKLRMWEWHGLQISTTPNTTSVSTVIRTEITNPATGDEAETKAKELYKEILGHLKRIPQPNTQYNMIGWKRAVPINEIIVIMSSAQMSALDVEIRGSLLNSPLIELSNRVKKIIIDDNISQGIAYQLEHPDAYVEIPRFDIPFTFVPAEGKGLVTQTFYNYWTRTGRNRAGISRQVMWKSQPLSDVVTELNLGNIVTGLASTPPTISQLEEAVFLVNPKYGHGNARYPSITTAGATMTGENIYTGDVALTYTVSA